MCPVAGSGALSFSTFAASYNRHSNYHNLDPEGSEDHPRVKRLKKSVINCNLCLINVMFTICSFRAFLRIFLFCFSVYNWCQI